LPQAAFHLQLKIRRAGLVAAKTEFIRMPKIVQRKVFRATGIGSIEKRTIPALDSHNTTPFARRPQDLSALLRAGR
jgi:hypothetical protein